MGHTISIESTSPRLRVFWSKPDVVCIVIVPYYVARIYVFQREDFISVCS